MSTRFKALLSGTTSSASLSPTSSKASPTTSSSSQDLCENCGVNPRFVENGGHVHPYCGRSISRKSDWVKFPVDCQLRDCKNQGRPQFGGFCCDSHARHAIRKNYVKACSQCGTMPQTSGDLCIACQRFQGSTNLRELYPKDPNFKSVIAIFVDNWKSGGRPAPRVQKVLEVDISRKSRNGYEAYRQYLEKRSPPSEIPTFHSSQCVCDLGTKPSQQLCEYPSCGLCCAVRSNFFKFASAHRIISEDCLSRGAGVYSYTNSARADKHATSCTSSPYRAMILCSVLVGKPPTTKSVLDGETVVVADAEAIIPTHIILYSN
ncbi:hypothetical protein DFH11DRAFT_1545640 [Phellopilus nigrolimitatus]|nr:hypothetical protein DFH11DRAFT_1545640 [Phellopilus nigrolimitatus]